MEHKDLDFNVVLLPLISKLITEEGEVDAIRELRLKALSQLSQILNHYKSLGYIDRILYPIAEKKSRMIMETTSKTEMEKVLKPHAPHYNGNEFFADKYNVPEEELICWCETSLRSPLNDAGSKRYYQVFSEIFPEEFARIRNLAGVQYGN